MNICDLYILFTIGDSMARNVHARIGIIGGSGLYDPEILEDTKQIKMTTPFGAPSAPITVGYLKEVPVAFLPRHGIGHWIPPHKINYRANIWALRELGVERIIAVSAVGSLQEHIKPGDLVVPDQFIDFTKSRVYTFYDGGKVYHVSLADPFCPVLRDLLISTAKSFGYSVHERGTYICIEGPRFSTRAESKMFRQFADIIGMTLVPEVTLARELEICYATLALVTDYDVWAEKPVDAQEVVRVMAENVEKAKKILYEVIPKIPEERSCICSKALENAAVD